ncbi:MAG: T9SS type A sorting domain-containing protein [Bacteroidia bacterium]|jgi:hypothetical protein|nr:T9SS type A sorting domain-containing protein [Bacteroidia bacterium]
MKHLFWIVALLFGTTSFAQITITNEDFAAVGDTIWYGTDTNNVLNSNLAATVGAAQVWDFTQMRKNNTSSSFFIDPAASPIAAPGNITHVLVDGSIEDITFINLSSSMLTTIVPNPAAVFLGGDAFIGLNSLRLPMNYLDVTRDSFTNRSVLPAGTLGLNQLADSIRVTFTVRIINTCDAWGTLKTPTNDYPTLRVKSAITTNFRLEGKNNLVPIWFQIPLSSIPFPLPNNQQDLTYIWIGKNSKYYLGEASMVTDNVTQLDEFRFQIPKPTIAGNKEFNTEALQVEVFPNPAQSYINFNFSNELSGSYQVKVYDNNGRLVTTKSIHTSSSQAESGISTQGWLPGIYHVAVFGNERSKLIKVMITE